MDLPEQETSAAEKISAYYSLVFPTVTFYVRTLSVTIGRRCSNNPNVATSSTRDNIQVDVDLGALKSVSRLHAKIEYDQDEDRFVLLVVGRNGAWVDGVWSASGTRAPLGERSQIQIASRTFHFVLPPPPPPEDTPSPSSQSSNNRIRSPSVDITSISPPSTPQSHSPPPLETKPPPPLPEPQLSTPKPTVTKTNSKKRKKAEPPSPPRPKPTPVPVEIPEKPSLSFRELIQRAIKALDGKATLQEICTWIMSGYEHYQHVDDKWMSSVRHTLSSDKHFKKMERSGGTRGKGFFWSVEEDSDEQPTPALASASAAPVAKPSKAGKGTKKKEKPSDSPPKKGGKSDPKVLVPGPSVSATPKPPVVKPTTSSNTPSVVPPAVLSTTSPTTTAPPTSAPTLTPATVPLPSQVTTGVFAYSALSSSSSYPSRNPYAPLTQGHWGLPTASTSATSTAISPAPAPAPSSSVPLPPVQPAPQAPDVSIPIILAPIPPSHPDYSPSHPNNSAKEGYMVLHERTLILDPDVFSGVDGEMLKELEKMGARKALSVLAGHMVRALKERRAARGRTRGRGRGRGQPKGRVPSFPHDVSSTSPAPGTAPTTSRDKDKVPVNVDARPQVPVSILAANSTGNGRADSPLVIVDDSDEDDKPAAKRRKLEQDFSHGR
ncbi:fork head domain-containing protein [Mycena maculata]|uniref:Fork head domain-containing protein n=1 Tax=Mycena maculata TaxID=230809 RepID=A0AAD7NTK1_9AGAR|nr:fork head domain-containing protein [Mycena maculata]